MIDISPYMQRLEWLKEWVEEKPQKITATKWELVNWVWGQKVPMIFPVFENISFDEYCNYKQSLSKTNQQ